MTKSTEYWRAVEATFGMKTVMCSWDKHLGAQKEILSRHLRPTGRLADMYPCPNEFGCRFPHEVSIWKEDDIAAVPVDDEHECCRVYPLTREDVIEYEMNSETLLRKAFGLLRLHPGDLHAMPFQDTFNIGSFPSPWGTALQIYIVLPEKTRQFQTAAMGLLATVDGPFLFMSLTPHYADAASIDALNHRKCLFVTMDELVACDAGGNLSLVHGLHEILVARQALGMGTPPGENVFRRQGDLWMLAFDGKAVHAPHSKGLAYIACLLRAQGRELHVAQVLAETAGVADVPALGSAGEVLAPAALAKYKERILELREQIEEAGRFNDIGRKARLEEELDAVTQQIGSAFGLYGRARKASDDAERVRKSVGTNIRRCLEKLTSSHPSLGEHLNRSLHTGQFLSYTPSSAVAWVL